MPQEMEETRTAMGWGVWHQAEKIADKMKAESSPFYIVFAAKPDKYDRRVIRAGFHCYANKPPMLLGLLVWYVDNMKGIFRFDSELSSPPDVPIDPKDLSDKASDVSERVAKKGKDLGVILS